MSKNKSLGSSPIGFQSGNSSALSFIPDLGVSSDQKHRTDSVSEKTEKADDKSNKKVVSYYLEENLIQELKQYAEEHSIYYSSLVSQAIKDWLQKNEEDNKAELEPHPFL